jgi:hypothetical protein
MKPLQLDQKHSRGKYGGGGIKKLFLFICLLLTFILLAGCGGSESVSTVIPIKTLPNTWTPIPATEIIITPTTTPTLSPTATIEPQENWWAMSIAPTRELRVNFAKETSDGGILLWAQERGQGNDVIRDVLIKLQKNGFLEWEKSIMPDSARVQYIQEMDDGTLLLSGFHHNIDFPNPFFIHLSENGEIISSLIYQGINDRTDRYYLQMPTENNPGYYGRAIIKGELPGTHYVSDYAIHSDGGMTVTGPIHGPITTDGSTFSYLRGLWAIRFNEENQIIWQRFFETKAAAPFFTGIILPDGSLVMTKDHYDYASILKLDPDGYTIYWKHYSPIITIQSISGTKDGSIIIAGGREYFTKLDPEGNILWSKELIIDQDQLWIQYVFETKNRDLILVLGSGQHDTIVARLKLEEPFSDCPQIQFLDQQLWEHFPYPPYNISSNVRVTPYPHEMVQWIENITLEEGTIEINEICRYRDP